MSFDDKHESMVATVAEADDRHVALANEPRARVPGKWQGTDTDRHEMTVLGRILDNTVQIALLDGGTAGLIWSNIVVACGMACVYASISELASIAPTSAGQYHWVSEFSPRSCQKYLSYVTGWLCFLGWQAGTVSVAFIAGTVIQGLIVLNHPRYVAERWHGTLLIIAVTAFSIFFNTYLAKKLPIVEAMVLALHVLGMFAIIIPLWILAPRSDPKAVFTTFSNYGGWPTIGVSVMVGLTTSLLSLVGFDCSVHMSEEIKDASRTLPRAIMGAVVVNSVLGFLMAVTLCFCLGDLDSILLTPTGYPFIQIIYNATRSHTGTNILVSIVILSVVGGTIATVATSSRQLWSFARDRGMPGSHFIAKVSPGWNIPLNAVGCSLVTTSLLSPINIGSSVALNAVLSLCAAGILSSYMICITCIILRRVRGEGLPPRRWTLGRFGLPINVLAMLFLMPVYIFQFFPPATPVQPSSINWACVIYSFVVGGSTIYYLLYGHRFYVPPVSLVKRDVEMEF